LQITQSSPLPRTGRVRFVTAIPTVKQYQLCWGRQRLRACDSAALVFRTGARHHAPVLTLCRAEQARGVFLPSGSAWLVRVFSFFSERFPTVISLLQGSFLKQAFFAASGLFVAEQKSVLFGRQKRRRRNLSQCYEIKLSASTSPCTIFFLMTTACHRDQ
jgi:hypothetical protein